MNSRRSRIPPAGSRPTPGPILSGSSACTCSAWHSEHAKRLRGDRRDAGRIPAPRPLAEIHQERSIKASAEKTRMPRRCNVAVGRARLLRFRKRESGLSPASKWTIPMRPTPRTLSLDYRSYSHDPDDQNCRGGARRRHPTRGSIRRFDRSWPTSTRTAARSGNCPSRSPSKFSPSFNQKRRSTCQASPRPSKPSRRMGAPLSCMEASVSERQAWQDKPRSKRRGTRHPRFPAKSLRCSPHANRPLAPRRREGWARLQDAGAPADLKSASPPDQNFPRRNEPGCTCPQSLADARSLWSRKSNSSSNVQFP